MAAIEWLKALFYGILEGITEWLPISSTGHLILLSEFLPFRFCADQAVLDSFWELFEVVVQIGAVLAVVALFFGRLFPFGKGKTKREKRVAFQLWGKVLLASVPAAVVGILGDQALEKLTGKDLDGWFYNGFVVAVALILYGIAFLLLERYRNNRMPKWDSTEGITAKTATGIGLFQVLSLIPGTSRSGSTILGASLLGGARSAAAEFSFFMAIPVMFGAGAVKTIGFFQTMKETGFSMPSIGWALLAVGTLASFLVSLVVIRFLTDFVKKHTFVPFGIYRILLGAAVLVRYFVK
ncbi:MAG: undecaprenyl-diphosphate phosphatase [Ruminococcaceae bacterium]|nr:undecaprenyl-diphosphate phosphatase [Oscillospiraceae bacterium]